MARAPPSAKMLPRNGLADSPDRLSAKLMTAPPPKASKSPVKRPGVNGSCKKSQAASATHSGDVETRTTELATEV